MSCSCVLPPGGKSQGGWHLVPFGDQGCFTTGRITWEGGAEACMRGKGIHNCRLSGQVCIYAEADAAFEPCPKYRAAVGANINREQAAKRDEHSGRKHRAADLYED